MVASAQNSRHCVPGGAPWTSIENAAVPRNGSWLVPRVGTRPDPWGVLVPAIRTRGTLALPNSSAPMSGCARGWPSMSSATRAGVGPLSMHGEPGRRWRSPAAGAASSGSAVKLEESEEIDLKLESSDEVTLKMEYP